MIKNNTNRIFSYPVIIIIILLNLAFLFLIKYQNQKLPISNFSFSSFGNVCNLFFALILIIGILVLVVKKDLVFETKIFLTIFIINQLLIITIYVLKIISLPFKHINYLGRTGDELFVGVILVFYIFSYFYLIYLVWLNIFKVKKLILLRAILNSSISMITILLVVFFFIVAKENVFNDELLGKGENNVGVVLGAAVWSGNKPSPSLAGRVDKALKLFEQNKISQIYLTGSNAPGELTEAEVAFKYIKDKGINTSQIFIEKQTTSTNEQIQFIKEIQNTKSKKNIVVISDGYHLVRVLEIAKFYNLKILVSASALSQSFEKVIYNNIRESIALTVFWLFAI